jgi:hypothetical protein
MREAVREAEERAEFLGVYRGNLSALDVFTEISKRVPEGARRRLRGARDRQADDPAARRRADLRGRRPARHELAKFPPFERAQIGAIETRPAHGRQEVQRDDQPRERRGARRARPAARARAAPAVGAAPRRQEPRREPLVDPLLTRFNGLEARERMLVSIVAGSRPRGVSTCS